jgi:hypothetical protein
MRVTHKTTPKVSAGFRPDALALPGLKPNIRGLLNERTRNNNSSDRSDREGSPFTKLRAKELAAEYVGALGIAKHLYDVIVIVTATEKD